MAATLARGALIILPRALSCSSSAVAGSLNQHLKEQTMCGLSSYAYLKWWCPASVNPECTAQNFLVFRVLLPPFSIPCFTSVGLWDSPFPALDVYSDFGHNQQEISVRSRDALVWLGAKAVWG